MFLSQLLLDKSLKAKEKTETISQWLLSGALTAHELLAEAETAKDAPRATCIEALEYATRQNPAVADAAVLDFTMQSLAHKAPRVKWESAKVIANVIVLFPDQIAPAIAALMQNANHEGTVVRWSAAFALGAILKLNSPHSTTLLPQLEALAEQESQNSIRKIYLEAVKVSRKR